MFTPAPKTRVDILKEVFPVRPEGYNEVVCRFHSRSMPMQDISVKGLLAVLRAGYGVDLLLQDGTVIINTDVSSARVKITYNTSVTPPSNGIIAWCPHSPIEGNILCAQSLDL
ncbi:hypothetical protein PFOEGONH_00008 [Klebsiella phage vB_KppS-Pokey]|nr:hypothetical protein PFOEGONH_00008 [Klebsiella phage vB_KppS-Pokey]CAK6605148.1 hypothetical protein K9PH25C2_LOCUS61 [Klebsiella phage vB_Kpn_K9PH25C2]